MGSLLRRRRVKNFSVFLLLAAALLGFIFEFCYRAYVYLTWGDDLSYGDIKIVDNGTLTIHALWLLIRAGFVGSVMFVVTSLFVLLTFVVKDRLTKD